MASPKAGRPDQHGPAVLSGNDQRGIKIKERLEPSKIQAMLG
jgi:hypothetical protein